MHILSGVKSHIYGISERIKDIVKPLEYRWWYKVSTIFIPSFFPRIFPLCKDWATKLLDPGVCKPLALLTNEKLFSEIGVLVYSFIIMDESSYSSTFYQYLIGKMVSHYTFTCIFQITSETENLIIYLQSFVSLFL